jgi:Tol biopolymer transport system component
MGGSLSVSGLRSIAIAASGTFIYRSDKRNASQLAWVDRSGRELDSLSDATSTWHYAPRLSPDGRQLLVGHYEGQGNLGEIWVHDVTRKLATRLTFDGGDDYLPVWVRPGNREFVYNSPRPSSTGAIYRAAIDRPNEDRLWLPGERNQIPDSITPDGKRVVFERTDELGKISLWIRDLEGDGQATRLTPPNEMEISADVSSDGGWLAYASDATRSWEVYVRRLDGSGGVVRISNDGGFQPSWRRDGRELFYVDGNGRLVTVPIELPAATAGAAEPARPGRPEILFDARLEESTDRQYDAAADGQRFVVNRSVANDKVPIVVVLDWHALLKKPAP